MAGQINKTETARYKGRRVLVFAGGELSVSGARQIRWLADAGLEVCVIVKKEVLWRSWITGERIAMIPAEKANGRILRNTDAIYVLGSVPCLSAMECMDQETEIMAALLLVAERIGIRVVRENPDSSGSAAGTGKGPGARGSAGGNGGKADPSGDILVINPGSTTTKIRVCADHNSRIIIDENIEHDDAAFAGLVYIEEQADIRRELILKLLREQGYDLKNLSAVVGRGGMLPELSGGGYRVNRQLSERMRGHDLVQHASNLGAVLAYSIAEPLGIPAFIYDATTGCELMDIATVTGIAGIEKYGVTHLLNSRAQDIRYAQERGLDFRKLNFINCHIGGGVTVNAMKEGRVIDVSSFDDGPMAPERSGGVPLLLYNRFCFEKKRSKEEMDALVEGEGGLYSYLGTKDCREVEQRIAAGDKYAAMVYEAMAYQIAKSVAAQSCALQGKVDVIILTGGAAHSKMLTDMIRKYCGHIAEVTVMPGEKEMEALADGALRMLEGSEEARIYNGN